MKTNRDLLKEAIADAKAVKETAIANAKAALEEAFTPHLKSLFASKLEEMEGVDEEETMKEMESTENEIEEIDLDELLAELTEEKDETKIEEKAEDEKAEAEDEDEDEEIEVSEMDEESLKAFVEDVIKKMVEDGELEKGAEAETGEVEAGSEELAIDEEVDLEALLAEVEKMEGKEEKVNEIALGLTDPEFIQAMLGALGIATGIGVSVWKDELMTAAKSGAKAFSDKFKEIANKLKNKSGADTQKTQETIESLQQELKEVNLLNAKLLYTNKIFKSKNLTENQKVKVLESFDKATTVKEVKLVYETLTESIKEKKAVNESIKGFASKSTAPVVKKQQIIESNDVFARMQRLAGLTKH